MPEPDLRLSVDVRLFGSQAEGTARPDSDIDVMLISRELAAAVVPRPLPHDTPAFYDRQTPLDWHHRQKHAWSKRLWDALGGNAGVERFRQLAAAKVADRVGRRDPANTDVFLYLPPTVSQLVWAVRLGWDLQNARLDLACATADRLAETHPALRDELNRLLPEPLGIAAKARAVEEVTERIAGVPPCSTPTAYASLSELLRAHRRDSEWVPPSDFP